jgi:hypothetical protein
MLGMNYIKRVFPMSLAYAQISSLVSMHAKSLFYGLRDFKV